jgi:hypothetical protein
LNVNEFGKIKNTDTPIRENITFIIMQNITRRLTAYRAAAGVAVAAALLLVWMNGAVGTEDDSPGLMFFGYSSSEPSAP